MPPARRLLTGRRAFRNLPAHMKRYWLPGLGVLALTLGTLRAAESQPPPTRSLSLQDCLQIALQHNLNVQITRYNPMLALYTLRGDYGAYDPSLTASGQHNRSVSGTQLVAGGFTVPGATVDANSLSSGLRGALPSGLTYSLAASTTDSYGRSFIGIDPKTGQPIANPFENSVASVAITATQPLLKNFWIDTPRLNIRLAKLQLKSTELALKLQIMQTAASVEQAYYDLVYTRENLTVQAKALELAQALVAENRRRVEVGAMAPLDEQQAEAQAETARAGLIAATNTYFLQENVLKGLLSDHFSEWQPIALLPTGTLEAPRQFLDLQESWYRGLSQRPDFLQAKLTVQQAGLQLKFAKNQLFPELDIFGTYGFNGYGIPPASEEFANALYNLQTLNSPQATYGGRITIPLSNIAARNAYKSSKASQAQALLQLKQMEQNVMIAIDNDIKQIRANYQQVQATRAAREYNEAALAAEQKKLENGKSTTFIVLTMQNTLTISRGSEIQALDTYNKSLSQLSLDEASTLERLGIDLEVK